MKAHRPPNRLLFTFGALLALLATTIVLAFQPFGSFNFPLAFTIALIKIALIAVIFMEIGAARPVTIAYGCVGIVWLSILWWLSALDYTTRPNFPPHF